MQLRQDNLVSVEKGDAGYTCQYTAMTDMGRELDRTERFYQFLLRVYPAIRRRMRKRYEAFITRARGRSNMGVTAADRQREDSLGDELEIGDTVRVLSYSQIKSTLDDKGYCRGLSFQESMEKYCSHTYEVLKIPKYVLDRGGKKVNRCKDVVILRGLYCDGKGTVLEEGCDRCCLHYWKTEWLRRVV